MEKDAWRIAAFIQRGPGGPACTPGRHDGSHHENERDPMAPAFILVVRSVVLAAFGGARAAGVQRPRSPTWPYMASKV